MELNFHAGGDEADLYYPENDVHHFTKVGRIFRDGQHWYVENTASKSNCLATAGHWREAAVIGFTKLRHEEDLVLKMSVADGITIQICRFADHENARDMFAQRMFHQLEARPHGDDLIDIMQDWLYELAGDFDQVLFSPEEIATASSLKELQDRCVDRWPCRHCEGTGKFMGQFTCPHCNGTGIAHQAEPRIVDEHGYCLWLSFSANGNEGWFEQSDVRVARMDRYDDGWSASVGEGRVCFGVPWQEAAEQVYLVLHRRGQLVPVHNDMGKVIERQTLGPLAVNISTGVTHTLYTPEAARHQLHQDDK